MMMPIVILWRSRVWCSELLRRAALATAWLLVAAIFPAPSHAQTHTRAPTQSRLPSDTFAPWRTSWQPYFAVRAQQRWLVLRHSGALPTVDADGKSVAPPIRYRYTPSDTFYDGNGLSIALGAQLHKYRLRTEIQLGYQYATGSICFQSDRDGPGPGAAYSKFSCKNTHDHLYETFFNIYYDIDLRQWLPKTQQHWAALTPYLGFGLGYSIYNGPLGAAQGEQSKDLSQFAHRDDASRVHAQLDIAKSGFLYAVHLGVGYKSYELGYRFSASDKTDEVFGGHAIIIGFRF